MGVWILPFFEKIDFQTLINSKNYQYAELLKVVPKSVHWGSTWVTNGFSEQVGENEILMPEHGKKFWQKKIYKSKTTSSNLLKILYHVTTIVVHMWYNFQVSNLIWALKRGQNVKSVDFRREITNWRLAGAVWGVETKEARFWDNFLCPFRWHF